MQRGWDLGLDTEAEGSVTLGLGLAETTKGRLQRTKRGSTTQLEKETSHDKMNKDRMSIVPGKPLDISNVESLLDSERELDMEVATQHVIDLETFGYYAGDIAPLKKALGGVQLPRREALWFERVRFSTAVSDMILHHLGITRDVHRWGVEDAKVLVQYLYATVLLVKCKSVSLNLSGAAWTRLLGSIFRLNGLPPESSPSLLAN